MQGNKKLNLLPMDVKNKYDNRYMIYVSSVVCSILALVLAVMYCNIGILNFSIKNLQNENAQYTSQQSKIEGLQKVIAENKKFIESYSNSNFPFYQFMNALESYRPYNLTIISVDSVDRLANEGEQEVKTEGETVEPTASPTPNKKDAEDTSKALPKLEYVKDLSDEKIVLRGYGESQEAISNYINSLSHLPYIADTQVSAIEQHKINEMDVNLFEVILIGKRGADFEN